MGRQSRKFYKVLDRSLSGKKTKIDYDTFAPTKYLKVRTIDELDKTLQDNLSPEQYKIIKEALRMEKVGAKNLAAFADITRLAVLLKEGGVYSDVDIRFFKAWVSYILHDQLTPELRKLQKYLEKESVVTFVKNVKDFRFKHTSIFEIIPPALLYKIVGEEKFLQFVAISIPDKNAPHTRNPDDVWIYNSKWQLNHALLKQILNIEDQDVLTNKIGDARDQYLDQLDDYEDADDKPLSPQQIKENEEAQEILKNSFLNEGKIKFVQNLLSPTVYGFKAFVHDELSVRSLNNCILIAAPNNDITLNALMLAAKNYSELNQTIQDNPKIADQHPELEPLLNERKHHGISFFPTKLDLKRTDPRSRLTYTIDASGPTLIQKALEEFAEKNSESLDNMLSNLVVFDPFGKELVYCDNNWLIKKIPSQDDREVVYSSNKSKQPKR